MEEFPTEIVWHILRFMSHPTADVMKGHQAQAILIGIIRQTQSSGGSRRIRQDGCYEKFFQFVSSREERGRLKLEQNLLYKHNYTKYCLLRRQFELERRERLLQD
jgi:hypothetical protein